MLKFHPFPEFLKEELNSRKRGQWHQTPRTPWFRVTSNAVKIEDINQEEVELTKEEQDAQTIGNSIYGDPRGSITNQSQSFSNSLPMATKASVSKDAPNRYFAGPYHNSELNPDIIRNYYDSDDHYRPRPGAESVSISKEGDSLSASFSWKCWTPKQLEALTPLFLWPGMSIIIEYGWSDMDVNPIDVSSFEERKSVFLKKPKNAERYVIDESDVKPGVTELHPIAKKMYESNGKYGVIGGVINDFDISYNEQGGFNCSTTIQEVNEGFLGLLSEKQVTRRYSARGGDTKKHTLYEYIHGGSERTGGNSFEKDLSNSKFESMIKISDETYIPWGAFENQILNRYTGYDSEKGSKNPGSQPLMQFDSRDSIVKYYPELLTTNDQVCVISPKTLNVKSNVLFRRISEEKHINQWVPNASDLDYLPSDKREKNGYLYNIYLNVKLIKEKITKDAHVHTAIENILNACSAACLDIWDFKIAEEGGMLKIIDQNALGKVKEQKEESYILEPFTSTSAVNNFSFSSNMDNQMKRMMWVSSRLDKDVGDDSSEKDHIPNSESDAFRWIFKGYKDPVYQDLRRSAPKEKIIRDSKDFKTLTALESVRTFENKYKNSSNSEEQSEALSYISLSDEKRREVQQAMYKDKDSPVNSDRSVPIECSFELPGTTGFQKFQVFDVANLPKIFSDGLFQVSDISHEITATDWNTSINAKFYVSEVFTQAED